MRTRATTNGLPPEHGETAAPYASSPFILSAGRHAWAVRAAIALAATLMLLAPGDLLAPAQPARAALPAQGQTQLVSVAYDGITPANQSAFDPTISADGRYIAFTTRASNLSVGSVNRSSLLYVRDLATQQTQLVTAPGAGEPDAGVDAAAISPDGNYVAFETRASNLGFPLPASGNLTLLWNRTTGALKLVSAIAGDPSIPASGSASNVSVSANGRFVAFDSDATGLTGDMTMGTRQVFLRDTLTDTTTLISRDDASPSPSGGAKPSSLQAISADGSKVAFLSASTLSKVSSGGVTQAYVRDVIASTTTLASASPTGTAGADRDIRSVSLSGDGHLVTLDTDAHNLLVDSALAGPLSYLRDLTDMATRVISVDEFGELVNSGRSTLAASGSVVAFTSAANGVTSGLSTSEFQFYKRDLVTNDTTLISQSGVGGGGAAPGAGPKRAAALTADGTVAAFSTMANNFLPGSTQLIEQVYVRNTADSPSVQRVMGADRYETSATLARGLFSADALSSPLYFATGASFPDALSASAAAARTKYSGGPVLLVSPDGVPTSVAAEIRRENPKAIRIVGGPNSVSDATSAELGRISGRGPLRIDGPDRYTVSAETSRIAFFPGVSVVYVASGEGFPDALAGGAVAGARSGPVLLTPKAGLSATVKAELVRLEPKNIVVLGGAGSVSEAVVTELTGIAPTTRVAGMDRYATAVEASQSVFAADTRNVYVASGETFPDALSASAAAAASHGPLLLVQKDGVPASVAAELQRLNPRKITVVGGPNTVSDRVVTELKSYLRTE